MDDGTSQDHYKAIQTHVRERLATGALPPGTSHTAAVVRGIGQQCVVCDAVVDPDQVAHEVQLWREGAQGTTVTVHAACYWLWRVETLRRAVEPKEKTSTRPQAEAGA